MLAKIRFSVPHLIGKELGYVAEACAERLSGDGRFTRQCSAWLEQHTGTSRALLTHSCTAALELAALLLDIDPGDEIIMPSYTFVSTANAFVLRRGRPVFVDIREDTLNLDEKQIEAAITPRTRAIVPVHYAGVACEMDTIMAIAQRHGLAVVEDAAQAVGSTYKGRALGSIGALGTYSFHETKNIIAGEGGALLVNDHGLAARAEIIREKGTDRSRFFRGEIDKYTWQEVGSSFLPSEILAAFLWAQLEEVAAINDARVRLWENYHAGLAELEARGRLRRPIVPSDCVHNGHIYYVLLADAQQRRRVLDAFAQEGIQATFHYVPLHSSPGGKRYGRTHGNLPVTEQSWQRLIRLPLSPDLSNSDQSRILAAMTAAL
ncbi:dTDP-4-amino-4,6-dideoxygalactose transaminase [Mesorhizobium sp. A623]